MAARTRVALLAPEEVTSARYHRELADAFAHQESGGNGCKAARTTAPLAFGPTKAQDCDVFMRVRLLRAVFALATLTVVWLIASPARANTALVSLFPPAESAPVASRAPLCDPRGATMLAPPPQRQDVELSLDIGFPVDDCSAVGGPASLHIAPGRVPLSPETSTSTDTVVPSTSIGLGRPSESRVAAPRPTRWCEQPGVRTSIERPPRV